MCLFFLQKKRKTSLKTTSKSEHRNDSIPSSIEYPENKFISTKVDDVNIAMVEKVTPPSPPVLERDIAEQLNYSESNIANPSNNFKEPELPEGVSKEDLERLAEEMMLEAQATQGMGMDLVR